MPVVPGLDGVYFPSFPYPADGVIVPLDANYKAVTKDGIPIEAVIMPYWYWQQIENYVVKTEEAVTALEAAGHPP